MYDHIDIAMLSVSSRNYGDKSVLKLCWWQIGANLPNLMQRLLATESDDHHPQNGDTNQQPAIGRIAWKRCYSAAIERPIVMPFSASTT
jgi:hypothetical protein